jgi:hypothetical protein
MTVRRLMNIGPILKHLKTPLQGEGKGKERRKGVEVDGEGGAGKRRGKRFLCHREWIRRDDKGNWNERFLVEPIQKSSYSCF